LSSPYLHRWPWSSMDYGPFPLMEDGRHVRRGYNRAMLVEMCRKSGLIVEEISFISGPISQWGSLIMNKIASFSPMLGWIIVLPLRPLPVILDFGLQKLLNYVPFCIAIEAIKPRIPTK
jgi:hypothetical protein